MIVPIFGWPAALVVTFFVIFAGRDFMARQAAAIAGHDAVQFIPAAEYVSTVIAVRIEPLIAVATAIDGPDECIAVQVNDVGRLGIGDIDVERIGSIRHERSLDHHTRHTDDYARLNDDLRLRWSHLQCCEKSHGGEGKCQT